MASNFIIALIIGSGIAFWIYYKLLRSSGGNSKNSAIASVLIALVLAVVGTVVLNIFLKKSN